MDREWYSPGEIRFKVRETIWLLQNLPLLEEGHWPPEATNYIDIGGGRSNKAPFITAAEYFVEITSRLERCGIDGLTLLAMECWGMSAESLAKYFKIPEWSVNKRRKTALSYVSSGPARRWMTTKKRKGETYQEFKKRKRN